MLQDARRPSSPSGISAAQSQRLGSHCTVCAQWQGEALCTDCRERFAAPHLRCQTCGLRLTGRSPGSEALMRPEKQRCGRCTTLAPPFTRTVAAVDYDFPWDGLILRMKHSADAVAAAPLAGLLCDAIERAYPARPPVDLIVPTPLTPQRLRERGHNQAWELARRVGRRLSIPSRASGLQRWPAPRHQHELGRTSRQENVRGVFSLDPAQRNPYAGRRLALVDDVMTTGATLESLALALLDAGALEIHVWVLARTPD